jgi:hypothetical protein
MQTTASKQTNPLSLEEHILLLALRFRTTIMISRVIRSLPQHQARNASLGLTARCASSAAAAQPWAERMPDAQFEFMRDVIAAPSPVGLESAMTRGVLEPEFEKFMPSAWKVHRFKGTAGMVVDTHPDNKDLPTVMVVGHCDKIRMQVRLG